MRLKFRVPFYLRVLLTCAGSSAAMRASAAAPTPTQGPVLFYFDQAEPAKCLAKLRDFAAGSERTVFTATTCPSDVIWDPDGARTIYVADGHVLAQSAGEVVAVELGVLPKKAKFDHELWLDVAGNLRLAYLDFAVDVESGTSTFTFEGKQYTPQLDFGTPAMAILEELRAGAWQRLEIKPTESETEDVEGLHALTTRSPAKPHTATLNQLLQSGQMRRDDFVNGRGFSMDCGEESPAVTAAVGSKAEGACSLPLDGEHQVVFGVDGYDYGSPYATAPILVCTNGCSSAKPLAGVPYQQPAIAISAGLLLVADAAGGGGSDPHVFTSSGTLVWSAPKGTSATWVPEGLVPVVARTEPVYSRIPVSDAGGMAVELPAGLSDPSEIIAMIEGVFGRGEQQMRDCRIEAQALDPMLSGEWDVSFSIGEDGSAGLVAVNPSSNANSPALQSCISKCIADWRFVRLAETQAVSKRMRVGADGWER